MVPFVTSSGGPSSERLSYARMYPGWCKVRDRQTHTHTHTHNNAVQWSLSIEDTSGTQLEVLYREVSLIQIRFVHSCMCCWSHRQCPH